MSRRIVVGFPRQPFDQAEVALGLSPSEQRKVLERHRDIEASGFQKSRNSRPFKSRNTEGSPSRGSQGGHACQKIREESGFEHIGNPGDKENVASGIAISRCPKSRRGDSDVEESTLTCIGNRRFVILGNHSSGNRETPKRDFPTG
jgi:hypothetical protein